MTSEARRAVTYVLGLLLVAGCGGGTGGGAGGEGAPTPTEAVVPPDLARAPVYAALAPGTLAPLPTIQIDVPTQAAPDWICRGDFNEDGTTDIATAHRLSNGPVSVILGDGTGKFGPALQTQLADNTQPRRIAAGDLNGDGHLDLVTSNDSSPGSSICTLLGRGDGTLAPPRYFSTATPQSSSVVGAVGLADFDSDGLMDVLISGRYGDYLFRGLGDGTLVLPSIWSDATGGSVGSSIIVSDFNSDGLLDFAVPNGAYSTAAVLTRLGDGLGGFAPPVTNSLMTEHNPYDITAADFNGDGYLDLATANIGGHIDRTVSPGGTFVYSVSVLLGSAGGSFALAPAPWSQVLGEQPDRLTAFDFNMDGAQDLYVLNTVSHTAELLLGRGDGSFASSHTLDLGWVAKGIVPGDFNNDLVPDTAILGAGITVLLGAPPSDSQSLVAYGMEGATADAAAVTFSTLLTSGACGRTIPVTSTFLRSRAPNVVLILCSGRTFGHDAYLMGPRDIGLYLQRSLEDSGRSVLVLSYRDALAGQAGSYCRGGYIELVRDLRAMNRDWPPGSQGGPEIVIVAHSHGGVWAHAAAREVRPMTIDALVDLDTNAFLFSDDQGHGSASLVDCYIGNPFDYNSYFGGSPPSSAGAGRALCDVVPGNVLRNLEVQIDGDVCLFPCGLFQPLDHTPNVRDVGGTAGIAFTVQHDCHNTVHLQRSACVSDSQAYVTNWLMSTLRSPSVSIGTPGTPLPPPVAGVGPFVLTSAISECMSASSAIRLGWTAAASAGSYQVYRDGSPLGSRLTTSALTFLDAQVAAGRQYRYYVAALPSIPGASPSSTPVRAAVAVGCGTEEAERLTSGDFSLGAQGWQVSGDFWVGTSLPNQHGAVPGYAAGGVSSDGTPKNRASGLLYQDIVLPTGATRATVRFWYNVTTAETGATVFDTMHVMVLDVAASRVEFVRTLSNLDGTSVGNYRQASFSLDVNRYRGRLIRVVFNGLSDSSLPTVFRIDDVRLTSDG